MRPLTLFLWLLFLASPSKAKDFDLMGFGKATSKIAGESITINQWQVGSYFEAYKGLSVGPSLKVHYSDEKIDLFDHYRAAELSLSGVYKHSFGRWAPYLRASASLASYFQADGKTKGSYEGGRQNFDYRLKGETKGSEWGFGLIAAVSEKLSLFGEYAFSSKRLFVKRASAQNNKEDPNKNYTFDERAGLTFSESGRFSVEARKRNRDFVAKTASFGIVYQL